MSLNSEMTALADAIREKSKKTEKMNISAMTAAVQSIQTGSGGCGGSSFVEPIEKDVNFYDYDGTRLYSYTTEEASELTELPIPQIDHDGLTFQEWNWTLDEIKAAGVADVGANYITTDGKTRLYIRIGSILRASIDININQYNGSSIVIDWGDGSDVEQSSTIGFNHFTHTYASTGNYIILISVTSGEISLGASSCQVITKPGATTSYYESIYSNMLLGVEIGHGVTCLSHYALQNCQNMEHISIPSSLTELYTSSLSYTNRMRAAVLPHDVTCPGNGLTSYSGVEHYLAGGNVSKHGDGETKGCSKMIRFVFGNQCSDIPTGILSGCISLASVVCTGDISVIHNQAFAGCEALKIIDMSQCSVIPTLESQYAFSNCPADMEIIVPASLLDEWKTATNWSVYAGNIKAKEA